MRGLVAFGANLLVSHAAAARGAEALRRLDFYVHADLYLNPTAEHADLVLPVSTAWEREALRVGFEITQEANALVQLRPAAVAAQGESRSDGWIAFALAERLGLGDRFWGGDMDAGYREWLAPSGIHARGAARPARRGALGGARHPVRAAPGEGWLRDPFAPRRDLVGDVPPPRPGPRCPGTCRRRWGRSAGPTSRPAIRWC